MALKDAIAKLRSSIANLLSVSVERAGMAWSELPAWCDEVTIAKALSHPAIWRAVNLISSDVAKVPINLYHRLDDGSREIENDWPGALVLRKQAAPGISGFTFRKTLTAHALLCGEAFAWIKRDGNRNPTRLIILDPMQTELDASRNEPTWVTTINGQKQRIDDSDMLHIVGFSWSGLAAERPLKVLSEAIQLELGVQQFAASFFKRGYAMSGFVKAPRPLSPEEIGRLRDEFRRRHSGASAAHDIAILSGGLEWESFVADPEKTQLTQSRDAGLRAIANIFGVPPHKLGDPTRTSYASIEAENADYLQTSLDQWLVAWETEATLKLLSKSQKGRYYFEHNRNAIMRTQFTDRVSGYAKLIEIGVLSPNEVRERENLNKRSRGDVYFTPANWLPQVGAAGSDQGSTQTGSETRD